MWVTVLLAAYNFAVYLLLPIYLLFGFIISCGRPSRFRRYPARLGLGTDLRQLPKDALWLHAVSVGEAAATAIMIPDLRALLGRRAIILSCVTPGGFAMAKKKLGEDFPVFYAPLDAGIVVRRFFRVLQPRALAVAEMEIWPNLFLYAGGNNVPLIIYNARMPDAEWRRYARFKKLFARVLQPVRLIAAQTAEDASRYCDIGAAIDRIRVAGNIKNDFEAQTCAENSLMKSPCVQAGAGALEAQACAKNSFMKSSSSFSGAGASGAQASDRPTIILASSHRGEEKLVAGALGEIFAPQSGRNAQSAQSAWGARLIIAPRHIARAKGILRLVRRRGLRASLLSEAPAELRAAAGVSPLPRNADAPPAAAAYEADVLILDTIGELAAAYSAADIAVMGGSFTKRVQGHNPLEAAAAGRPLIFGPHMNNFRESRDALLSGGAAVQAADTAELVRALTLWLDNPGTAHTAGARGRAILESMRGASRQTAFLIANFAR